LQFKQVKPDDLPLYSVRVMDTGYRALGEFAGDRMIWRWIGTHEEYIRQIRKSDTPQNSLNSRWRAFSANLPISTIQDTSGAFLEHSKGVFLLSGKERRIPLLLLSLALTIRVLIPVAPTWITSKRFPKILAAVSNS
jgi:hypothetical protein